jgi:hypothetical protein
LIELDHLAFGAADIASTREDLVRLGFSPTPISHCSWKQGGTERRARSVSVVFGAQYLDFVEIQDAGWDAHLASSGVYARGVAPSGIVLRGPAPRDALSTWRSRGAEADEPYGIVRVLEGADPPEIHYEFLALRGSDLPLGLIRDAAPRAMRTPAWTAHANGATGIERLHLRVPSIAETRRSLEPFEGVDLETARISLHEGPEDPYLREVAQLLPEHTRPTLLAVEIGVHDLEETRRCLVRNGVTFGDGAGRLSVRASEGHGMGFRFVV